MLYTNAFDTQGYSQGKKYIATQGNLNSKCTLCVKNFCDLVMSLQG